MTPLRRFSLVLPVVLCCAALFPTASAQPLGDTLRILRVDTSNFPTIRVHVRAFCGGTHVKDISAMPIRVVDGNVDRQFSVWCPTETQPMSVTLCLDRSGSVAGTSIYRIQEGARQFVQLMEQHTTGADEAGLVSFNENPYRDAPMTTDLHLLYAAIQQLYPWGATALWDAVMLAIFDAESGTNPNKAVVLLSDGGDNSSMNSLSAAIDYARQRHIPVYTLCLMYHASAQEAAWMKMLADSTGGMFLPLESPDDIVTAFTAIASIIQGGSNDCILEYKIECPDGGMRTATVTANVCGKMITETFRYRAPRDPNLPKVVVRFDSSSAYENGDLYIPVLISAVGMEADVSELTFKVLRQDSVVFVRAITAGHFAANFTVNHWQDSDTLLFTLGGSAKLNGSDTLMVLHFRTGSFSKDSTYQFRLFYFDKKTAGCMLLQVYPGNFAVFKRPVLQTGCTDTLRVHWDRTRSMYAPNTLVFSTLVSNGGQITARNTKVWITLPQGMRMQGGADTVALFSNNLGPGGSEMVSFNTEIIPSDTARDFIVCVSVKPDSGAVTTCCTRVVAEKARPALRCTLSIPPEVRWSDSLRSYIPKTFPVTLTVRNPSPVPAKTVEARLSLPDGFSAPGSPPVNLLLTPDRLTDADTATVTWIVTPRDRMNSDTVAFCVYASNDIDSTVCCEKMFITSTPVRAGLACGTPRVVTYNEDTQTWDPPQFIASTMVRNICGIDMAQAVGRITLPPFLTLAPGENMVKDLPNGALVRPGDSATLAWNVVAGKPNPGTYQICIDISASNFPGARCCIPLIVQTTEAVPVIACSLGGPDTVRYVNGAYEPNPIVLHVGAQNLGASPAKNVYAALLQGADLSIDGTDQALKIMSDSLAGGHDTTTTFRVRVLDRLKSRYDTIRVSVYAANGGAVVCEKIVWIEAVTGPAMELTCAGPDSLAFSELLDEYVPNPYTFTITAKNVGTAPADSVLAEFLLPPDVTLAGGEQAAKLLTPSTLGVGQSGTASWRVVSVLRDTPRIDTLRAQVRSRGRTVAVTQPCLLPVRVPARRVADLDISCAPVGNIRVIAGKYDPDPFLVRLTLTNRGNAEVFDISARVLSMGSRIALADSGIKLRPALGPRGGQTVLEWSFLATPRATGDSVEICFLVGALRQNTLLCCTKVWLPPLPPAGIEVLCSSVDTVRYDVNLGRYPSPIPVTTTVTNTSQVPVDTVRATLILPPGLQLASGETSDKRIVNILPQQQVHFGWQMDVVLDTSTVAKARTVRIQYFAAGGLTTCDVTIIVLPPPQGRDSTGFELHCSSPDTIHYVNPQVGLQPSPFIVRADIRNTGTTPLDGISATLQLPAGVMLGSGENVTKPLGSALGPGQTATITWSCIPGVSEVPITGVIEIRVNATGLTSQLCATRIYIERVYRVVQLLIPRGNVVRTGELILVPAIFTNPSLAVVTAFRFGVRYDPATVRVEGINVASSLTQGWTVTGAEVAPGHFLFTGSSTVPLNGSGTVVGLVIRALSGDGSSNVFGWKLSDLTLDSVSFPAGVDVELQHGDIVTSAECLLPLKGTSRFVLRPNHPNPFRHSTTISYALAPGTEPATVQIDIYDPFGRLVRRFEEGVRSPGDHSVTWDATGLPEGVYYCHLVADGRAQVRAMIMAR